MILSTEEKAKRYDQWFDRERCPACHFQEKHLTSCSIKALEEALEGIFREFKPEHMDKVSRTTVGSKAHATLTKQRKVL